MKEDPADVHTVDSVRAEPADCQEDTESKGACNNEDVVVVSD